MIYKCFQINNNLCFIPLVIWSVGTVQLQRGIWAGASAKCQSLCEYFVYNLCEVKCSNCVGLLHNYNNVVGITDT